MNTHNEKLTILVVDDISENLVLMHGLLKDDYHVRLAKNGEKALEAVMVEPIPDLILLDIMMPEMDGYEVCQRMKKHPITEHIPIIFLTAKVQDEDEKKGLDLGASDYITKPISPSILLSRVANHLKLKKYEDFLRDQNAFLESEVARRTADIAAIQDVTILALSSLAETRDTDTGNHIRRTQIYVKLLAQELRKNEQFTAQFTDEYIATLFKSAPLHDLGKVGIPDKILLKPGKLTEDEFNIMKTHTTLGCEALSRAEELLGTKVAFLSCAKEIALSHQEKWDGSGYPSGLVGDQIPLAARLMAVADVYDALISRRVYKDPMSHEKASSIIIQGRGTHFDPDVVAAFKNVQNAFLETAQLYDEKD